MAFKHGSDWNLPYKWLNEVLLEKLDYEEDGVSWTDYKNTNGDIVVSRLLPDNDKDQIWDDLYDNGRHVYCYKYSNDHQLYEKCEYIYSKDTNKLISRRIYDADGNFVVEF